ncbi:hypothetical protein ACFLWW_03015 [Chloroflexota bacterium]
MRIFVNDIVYALMYKTRIIKFLTRWKQIRSFLRFLNSITAGCILQLTSRLTTTQRKRIKEAVDSTKKTIALCFPPGAYGDNLGNIADKLKSRSYNTLVLKGTTLDSVYEDEPKDMIYITGGMWANVARIADVDLFICLEASEYFPESGKVIMFVHDIHDSPAGPIDYILRIQSTYDYFFLPSRHVVERVKQQVLAGREKFHSNKLEGKEVCLIGGGYPKLDSNLRYFEKYKQDSKTIIIAPTVIKDFEGLVLLPSYAEKIIEAILDEFPEYDLIFRPHPHTLSNTTVQEISQKYKNEPRFTFDDNGNFYMGNYSKAALMITDMSGTAYTYAFTTLRPVVFFSPNEAEVLRRFGEYQYFIDRSKVGYTALNIYEMLEKIEQLIVNKDDFTPRIKEYRDSVIYNIGISEDYFVDNLEYILENKKHTDWIYI